MKLKPEDVGLFYELFLLLLDYVNERFHVTVQKVKFTGESIDPRDAIEAAHFLWERTWIIDDHLDESKLSCEHREIIHGWKRCISGTFIIERHLKKGTVFISTDDETVYLVNGITDSWKEMLGGRPTPLILKATLIPFKNVIISDGLVTSYAIRFGRNSAAEFMETYMKAKRNGNLITNI